MGIYGGQTISQHASAPILLGGNLIFERQRGPDPGESM